MQDSPFLGLSSELLSDANLSSNTVLKNSVELLDQITTSWDQLSPLLQFVNNYIPALTGYSEIQLLGLAIIALLWIGAICWTLRDAIARSDSLGYQFFSALLVTFLSPLIGLPLYLAFRPLCYKRERGYRREALMQNVVFCPHCENLVDKTHNACVYCGESLKTECKECHTSYYRGYLYCPECGAPNIE